MRREGRRLQRVPGKKRAERDERLDVVLGRLAYLGRPLPLGHLHHPVRMLRAEAQPKPRIDEGRVGRGHEHEHVVLFKALFEPACGGLRPDVPQQLRLPRRMPGGVEPDVRAPVLGAGAAEHVRALGVGARRAVCEQGRDLRGVVDARGKLRNRASMALVPLREQGRGGLDVLLREGDD